MKTRMIRPTTALLIFASIGLWASGASAQKLVVNVDGADFRPYPLGAPSFVVLGDLDRKGKRLLKELNRTLRSDIELARAVELIPPKTYLDPKGESWTKPTYKNWVNVGASGLIRCALTPGKPKVQIGCRFFDVYGQRQILAKSYEHDSSEAYRGVHQFVDEVVKHLTGELSIFSTRLTFVRATSKTKSVYVAEIDGRARRRISPEGILSLLPAWSPTGKHVLFTSYLKGNPDLFRATLGSKNLEWISKKRGLNTGAAVSPNGKKIALTLSVDGNTEIYLMNWDGTALTRLTNSWGQDVSPTWNPKGTQIAFVSSRSGQPHIYLMNSDGSNQKRLTFQGNYNQEPNWSPHADGQIVFTARDERLKYDIFLVNPADGEITRLTQDDGTNDGPCFSPDGHHIVFTSTRGSGNNRKLYIMDADGRHQTRVSKDKGDYESPRWGPRMGY